jgi:hypothetical protein
MKVLEKDADPLALEVESGLSIASGQKLQLIEPVVSVNGKALSPQLVSVLTGSLSNRFDLRTLEEAGITTRLLQFQISPGELEAAAFVRVNASKPQSASRTGSTSPLASSSNVVSAETFIQHSGLIFKEGS